MVRTVVGTAVKDLRSLVRMSRFDRSIGRLRSEFNPLFVWQYHSLFQRAGLSLATIRKSPFVLFVDAPQVWEAAKWGVKRPGWGPLVERLGEVPQFRQADLVACVSQEVAEATIARGANPDRVIVTPSTADAIRRRRTTTDMRKELGLGNESIVGWLGSFRTFHHAEMLVRAVALAQLDRPMTLIMVGDGPTRTNCMQIAEDLGVDRVHFPGWIPHEKVPDLLAVLDVAVVTRGLGQEFHGSPTKLKEYLAAGCAVVAPAVGEVVRMLENERDVLMYAPGDETGLVRAMERVLGDQELRTKLKIEGQRTYDRLFTLDRQLDLVTERLGLPPNR